MLHYILVTSNLFFFLASAASVGAEIKPEIEIFRRTSTHTQKVKGRNINIVSKERTD